MVGYDGPFARLLVAAATDAGVEVKGKEEEHMSS